MELLLYLSLGNAIVPFSYTNNILYKFTCVFSVKTINDYYLFILFI